MTTTKHERRRRTRSTRGAAADQVQRAIEPGSLLIESAEYEYTTPLSMPGLLIAIDRVRPSAPSPKPSPATPRADGLLSTEDGDTVSACQLPGRIAGRSPSIGRVVPARPDDEVDLRDEYSERAAMQWPGLTAVPQAQPETPGSGKPRGLCADCLLRDDCRFPKPESGVWRCEEYQ